MTRSIHDRMPVVLDNVDIRPWLNGERHGALRPAAEDRHRMWPVSRRVNKTGTGDDDPTLIDEVTPDADGPMQPRLSGCRAHAEAGGRQGSAERALHVIERWNAERSPLWSPTIRCAVVAGTPWLDVYCPGCAQAGDRYPHLGPPPLASVGSLCSACGALGVQATRLCRYHRVARVPPARGGAKVSKWNSCTAALSAQRTLKGRVRLSLRHNIDVIDDEIRGIVARNWPYCWRNFRRTKTDGEKDASALRRHRVVRGR